MSLLTSFNPNSNEYFDRYAGSFIDRDVIKNSFRFACLFGDRDNMGLVINHMGKYVHELLQTLVNWDENLRINTDKNLLFLLPRLLVTILARMRTSDMLDDDLID